MPDSSSDNPSLSGRVGIVTGAGRGIGRAIALDLAAAGASVALLSRTRSELEQVAREAGRALVVPCDVTVEQEVASAVATVRDQLGAIDFLINNAGQGRFVPLLETPLEDWQRMIGVNLTGTFLVTKHVLPDMLSAARGNIINIASIAGKMGLPNATAYCASKWGVLGLTAALAAEVRKRGVRVTALCPGSVDTPIWDQAGVSLDRSRMLSPERVASAVRWILTMPPDASVDEIVLMPPDGLL